MRSRIAPTPSGKLHIGNVYNFIMTWWFVKSHQGTLYLRIDDSDKERVRRSYIEDIFVTLDWLGFTYDTGPTSVDDFLKNFSQQNKKEEYRSYLNDQKYLFSCDCSRKDLAMYENYPGYCSLKKNEYIPGKFALRVNDGENYPIIWRKDDLPAYHLYSIVDDIKMKMTHIIRGDDLEYATSIQKKCAPLLNLTFESKFFHHETIKLDGQKISKTQKGLSVREQFKTRASVFKFIAPYLGVESFDSLDDLLKLEFNSSILLPH